MFSWLPPTIQRKKYFQSRPGMMVSDGFTVAAQPWYSGAAPVLYFFHQAPRCSAGAGGVPMISLLIPMNPEIPATGHQSLREKILYWSWKAVSRDG